MPKISPKAHIAKNATIVGEVTIGDDCSIFYGAVLRGDDAEIIVGDETNIQDNAVVHCSMGNPTVIGRGCTIGHGAIVHSCIVGDNTLLGMGSIVMDNAHVGNNCIIGAGSLVPGGMDIPDGSVAFGNPAKIRREMTAEDIEANKISCVGYIQHGKSWFD